MYLHQREMQMTISRLTNVLNMYIVLEESHSPITKAQDKEVCKKKKTTQSKRSIKYVANISYVAYGVVKTCKNVIFGQCSMPEE